MVTSRLQLLVPNVGSLFTRSEEKAAKEPEMIVLTTEMLTAAPSPGFWIEVWEPPLNAKNPKNRTNPPRAAIYNVKRVSLKYI